MKTPEEMAESFFAHNDYNEFSADEVFVIGYKAAENHFRDDTEKVGPQWISVKDRLPEEKVPVLVCNSYGLIFTTSYFNFEQWGYHMITHWMELPARPKEEK